MLRPSAFKPRKRNAPRPAWKRAEAFGQWLRGRPCACEGRHIACGGKVQAAHTPHKASKGMGSKCADQHMIPLSESCHMKQHHVGWQTFASLYLGGADPVALAAQYWSAWPGRKAWEERQ